MVQRPRSIRRVRQKQRRVAVYVSPSGRSPHVRVAEPNVKVERRPLIESFHPQFGCDHGRLKQALKVVAAAGRMREDMVDVFAHILLASLLEVAFMVARSPDPRVAASTGRKAMKELLERLLTKSDPVPNPR
jgi:hypothetical protein